VAIIFIAEKKPISNARAAILFFALALQINAVCAKITAAASQQRAAVDWKQKRTKPEFKTSRVQNPQCHDWLP
jgi:hypothetical protein